MADGAAHIDLAAEAIGEASKGIAEIAPPKRSKLGRKLDAAPGQVPAVKQWWLPVSIIVLLFVGQVVAAIVVNDTTIGTVFAAGAVIVAVLAAIVAVLSYAQQASIPLADIVEVLEKLLTGLEELKKAHEDAHPITKDDAKDKAAGDGSRKPRPTEKSTARRPSMTSQRGSDVVAKPDAAKIAVQETPDLRS